MLYEATFMRRLNSQGSSPPAFAAGRNSSAILAATTPWSRSGTLCQKTHLIRRWLSIYRASIIRSNVLRTAILTGYGQITTISATFRIELVPAFVVDSRLVIG